MKQVKFEIGSGENNFTMSRGSFKYKQSISNRRTLKLTDTVETEGGFDLHFSDPKTGMEHVLSVKNSDGKLTLDYVGEGDPAVNRYWLTFAADPKEHFYGCGETYSEFDLRGQKVRIWVAEHQNTQRIGTKLIKEKIRGKRPEKVQPFDKYESYYAQPTFTSSGKYYMHVNINAYSEFDFTKPGQVTLYLQDKPSLVTESGADFTEVSRKLSALLGRQPQMPDWTYDGPIMACQDWKVEGKDTISAENGIEILEKKLANAKAAGVPIKGFWCQDWCGCRCTGFGYQVMWNWHYDEAKYPNLPEKIKEWKEQGVRFLGYINPFIALEKDIYQEAAAKGYCVKDKEGKDYLVTITTFPAAMVDFTNPEAYEWYKGLIKKNMIGIGMGGWMADFGEYLPTDCVLYSGEDPALVHNTWPAIWAKMNREALQECGVEDEVFFFTRAGHTGTVKYSTMMWTGDQHVDWSIDDGLASTIPATLSLAMSGYGVAHSDVGGYTTVMHMTRSKELMMRWEEMNAFTPLFRGHEGNQPSRDVQFDDDEELLAQLSRCGRRHAALKPYLKDLAADLTKEGTPVMRPLFYHYEEEPAYTIKTEYLLGRDLLVAPIYKEGSEEREVYFPADTWVNIFTGKEYQGGMDSVKAPMGQPPVFVRKDSSRFEELMAVGRIQ